MKRTLLVFSHQINAPAVRELAPTTVYLIEDARCFRTGAPLDRAMFHRATLQAFRERFLVRGVTVQYFDAATFKRLTKALEAVIAEKPEALEAFDPQDAHIERQMRSVLEKAKIPLTLHPPVGVAAKSLPPERFVTKVFPHVDPSRYVEEAVDYAAQLVRPPEAVEIEFDYPVTDGEVRDWLEELHTVVAQPKRHKEGVRDLAALLRSGMVRPAQLEAQLEADMLAQKVTVTDASAFRNCLPR